MLLHVKNMVCDRCLLIIRQQMEGMDFKIENIILGKVTISPEPDEMQLLEISAALKLVGFELIDSEKRQLVERIKSMIIGQIHRTDNLIMGSSFSELLSAQLHRDYAYLSRLYSTYEDDTIEKYIIRQKIEKVKELLEYGQLNLNQIADKMGYSSSAHLSAQFKQVTGITPRAYKASELVTRKPIDKLS